MGSNLTKKDYKFFEIARKVASQSTFKNFHLGAVIVYKGRVVSTGYNSNKTHPAQKKYNKYRHFNQSDKPIQNSKHAEISALVGIPKCVENNIDFTQCKIYIYRISPGKRLGQGLARPCSGCIKALKDVGISNIYYTTEDGFAHEKIF